MNGLRGRMLRLLLHLGCDGDCWFIFQVKSVRQLIAVILSRAC